jgi:TetR/AcrR family transcriptional regulator, transcriptional repressor for nem operon
MCLCGIMGAEADDLPDAVRTEVVAFADLNIMWLAGVLAKADAPSGLSPEDWAAAVYAAIGGAQLAARSRGDVAVFDSIIESYRASGLIPG